MKVVSVLLGAAAVAGVGLKPTFAKLVHLDFSNVSVLLGAVAVAGVGSKPTFAKLVHLDFSNICFFGCTCIRVGEWRIR